MSRTAPPESWGHSTVQTACPLDCPDSCTLHVTVEKGRIVRIEGGHAPGTAAAPATPTPSTTTSRPAFVPVRKAARTVPASRIAGNTALADNEWSEF